MTTPTVALGHFLGLVALPGQAVLNDNAQVDKGDNARLSSFVGAIAIADLVKTTLGPKGNLPLC